MLSVTMDDFVSMDGGYSWLVMFMSMLTNFIVDGILMVIGVFHVMFLDVLKDEPEDRVALISAVNTGTACFSCLYHYHY